MSASADPGCSAGMEVRSAGAVRCASSGATAAFSTSLASSTVSVRRSRASATAKASRRAPPTPTRSTRSSGGSTKVRGVVARSDTVTVTTPSTDGQRGQAGGYRVGDPGGQHPVGVVDGDLDDLQAGPPGGLDRLGERGDGALDVAAAARTAASSAGESAAAARALRAWSTPAGSAGDAGSLGASTTAVAA